MENNGRDENKIDGVVVGVVLTTTLLTSKLLVNTNSNIRTKAQWNGPADSVERRYAAGVRWWDQEDSKKAMKKSQCPLLDGGEDTPQHRIENKR